MQDGTQSYDIQPSLGHLGTSGDVTEP